MQILGKVLSNHIKLLSPQEKELYSFVRSISGLRPRNLQLYKLSCLHRSAHVCDGNGVLLDNERLEYLGDAVLNAIVADMLYRRYPSKNEGFLTNARSKLVQRDMLNRLADEIGLTSRIKAVADMDGSSVRGNALEAFVGAVYLDRGFRQCRKFVCRRLFAAHVDLCRIVQTESNYKARVLEWAQKHHLDVQFADEAIDNGRKAPAFHSTLVVSGIKIGEGDGRTKRDSQQAASKAAYLKIMQFPSLRRLLMQKNKSAIHKNTN